MSWGDNGAEWCTEQVSPRTVRLLSRNTYIQGCIKLTFGAVFILLQITCLDISSGGGLGVSTSTDGTMKIWQAANGEIRVRASSFVVCCLWRYWSHSAVTLVRLSARCGLGQTRIWLLIEKLIEIWHLRGFKSNLLESMTSPKGNDAQQSGEESKGENENGYLGMTARVQKVTDSS